MSLVVEPKLQPEAPPETGETSSQKPPSRARGTGAVVVYNILAAVALLLLLEGLASVSYSFHDAFAERPLAERLYTEYDRDLGWISLPNVNLPNLYGPGKYLRTNSQRFRSDTDFSAQVPPGKTRIICSGDSFTFGYGMDNNHTWPQALTNLAPNIETVNMGQGGYGADQAYLWYQRDGAHMAHDIQILAVVSPDLYRMQSATFYGYGKPVLAVQDGRLVTQNVPVPRTMEMWAPRLSRAEKALANLSLTRMLRSVFHINASQPVTESQKELNQDTAKVVPYMLDDLIATNRASNSVFVLVYLPVRLEFTENVGESWRRFLSAYAQSRGILFIDLAEDFRHLPPEQFDKMFIPWGSIYFPGAAGHYTEAGNAFVAEQIYHALLANPATAARLHGMPAAYNPSGYTH